MVPRTPFCRRVFSVWSNVLDLIPEIIRLSGCLLLLQPSGRWHAVSNANRMPRPSPSSSQSALFILSSFPPALSGPPLLPFRSLSRRITGRVFAQKREPYLPEISNFVGNSFLSRLLFVNSYFDLENVISFRLIVRIGMLLFFLTWIDRSKFWQFNNSLLIIIIGQDDEITKNSKREYFDVAECIFSCLQFVNKLQ